MEAVPSSAKIAGPHGTQYENLFKQADVGGQGIIGAAEAAKFLKKSGLKETALSQIWDFADPAGRGFLDKQGFFVAVKLIALAQNGKEVTMNNIHMQIPPPAMGTSNSPAMAPLGSLGSTWAIPAAEKTKYDEIFEGLVPVNGLLSGDKVRPVLLNSKLPVDILGRVWDLSDIDKDGFLDREEFAVAMHLVYKALEKEPVPMTLPPDLVPPSKRLKNVISVGVPVLPELSAHVQPPASEIDTGSSMPIVSMPITLGSDLVSGASWVVTSSDKAKYDEMFKKADTDMDGYVNGLEIKDIFLHSGLSQTVLAHLWNLCDMNGTGKLNTEQFSLAMYLIQEKLKGIELPPQLPTEMIPPSMRAASLSADDNTGFITDFNTSGMKELDFISKEIEDIKREKIMLEQDKTQKEADIRIQNGELQSMQKELDAILQTVKQLETQKGEAQKRLDELDDKRMKAENITQDLKDKCGDEQKLIDKLRSQIMSTEMSAKNQEEELKRMRDELNTLRQDEVELEQKVETGRGQLVALAKSMDDTQTELAKTKNRVLRLQDTQNKINQCINQYNALISGDSDAAEPDLTFLQQQDNIMDVPANRSDSKASSREDPYKNANTNSFGGSDDPFKDDPFKNTADPFIGGDPFSNTQSAAFGEDHFADAFKSNSSKKSTAFGDGFGVSAAPKEDPFGGNDPFGAAFGSPKSTSHKNDPFDPFGGSGISDMKSPVNPDDPFGTGSFATQPSSKNTLNIKFPSKRDKSPAPTLPPKQKKAPPPPRPPMPKSSRGPSPAPNKKKDDFDDPFFSSGPADTTDSFANFADFGSNKASTEADQLAWATKNSQQEWDKQRRLQEQEQAELELAIQLSKQSG